MGSGKEKRKMTAERKNMKESDKWGKIRGGEDEKRKGVGGRKRDEEQGKW